MTIPLTRIPSNAPFNAIVSRLNVVDCVLRAEISDEPFFPGMWAGKCAWSSPGRVHFWGSRFPSAGLTPLFWGYWDEGLVSGGVGGCQVLCGLGIKRDTWIYPELKRGKERRDEAGITLSSMGKFQLTGPQKTKPGMLVQ